MNQPEFLPTTREEMASLGWDELDVLLVSGDAYVDSHSFAASLLGRWLTAHGYKTGIIAQPRWDTAEDVSRLGRPRLFAGVSAGAMDSLLAHYTAFRKKRSQDAYSPGGAPGLRPNRAGIVYTGLLRQAFPGLPVAAGGIEASLRRASHYDFWSDSLRRSFVLDSKADAVLYGMGEKSILALAELFGSADARLSPGPAIANARLTGSAYAVHPDAVPADAEELPSHEAILAHPPLLIKAAMAFERQMLQGGPALVQRSGGRAVVFEPPAALLTEAEMDAVYGLPFTRRAHPSYTEPVPAAEMIEGSIVSHRGCGGGCSFCALAGHQGRVIQSRSRESILGEVRQMAAAPEWKGSLTDIGGPSANMWQAVCAGDPAVCGRESCLYPKRCRNFRVPQEKQAELLRAAAAEEGVNHVRAASGIRHDLALENEDYLQAVIGEFTGGQLKIAPEHISEKVLRLMRKPSVKLWNGFLRVFKKHSEEAGKEQYLVPYLMSAFPGCTDQDMQELAEWLRTRGWRPQQVQCFIPTPGTVASAMFFAGEDTEGHPIQVARTDAERLRQHRILVPDAEPAAPKSRGRGPSREREGFRRHGPARSHEGGGGRRGDAGRGPNRSGRPPGGGPRRDYGNGGSGEDSGRREYRPNRNEGGFRREGGPGRPQSGVPRRDYGSGGSGEGSGRRQNRPNRNEGGFRREGGPGRPQGGGPRREYGNGGSGEGSGRREYRPNRNEGGFRREGGPGRPQGGGPRREYGNGGSGEGSGRREYRPNRNEGGFRREGGPGRPQGGGPRREYGNGGSGEGSGRREYRPNRNEGGFRREGGPGRPQGGGPRREYGNGGSGEGSGRREYRPNRSEGGFRREGGPGRPQSGGPRRDYGSGGSSDGPRREYRKNDGPRSRPSGSSGGRPPFRKNQRPGGGSSGPKPKGGGPRGGRNDSTR